MSDTGSAPIIKINIDDDAFTAYTTKWQAYQRELDAQPGKWEANAAGIKKMEGGFGAAASEMVSLNSAIVDPRLTKVFSDFQRISVASAASWKVINQNISESYKNMSGLARLALQVGAFGGIAGLAGLGVAGATYKAVSSASRDVADDYKRSKNLGLPLGQERAFGTYFDTFGLGSGDLETAANNKGDPTKFTPYAASGMSFEEYSTDDTEKLTFESFKKMSAKYAELEKNNPANAALIAKGMHLTNVFSLDQLRNGAHDLGAIDQSQSDYEANWQKMGVSEKAAKEGTAFTQHQDANLQTVKTAWDEAVLKLAPALNTWSDAATKLTVGFLNKAAPQAAEVADAINSDQPVPREPDGAYPHTVLGGLTKLGYGIRDVWSDLGKTQGIQHDPDAPFLPKKSWKDWWSSPHPFGQIVHEEQPQSGQAAGGKVQTGAVTGPGTNLDRNNPLNLKEVGGKSFRDFDTAAEGLAAADNQIMLNFKRGATNIDKMIEKWAPAADGNNHEAYVKDVVQRTGWDANMDLDLNDAKKRAILEDAMRHHETGDKYAALDPQGSLASLKQQAAALPQEKKSNVTVSQNDSDNNNTQRPTVYAPQAPVFFHVTLEAPAGTNTNVTVGGSAR